MKTIMSQTSLGLEERTEAALSYLLFFFSGLIIFLLEEKSLYVRFHAAQSTVTFISLIVLSRIVLFIRGGFVLSCFIELLLLILWIVGIIKAYQGEWYKFPLFGDIAASILNLRI
ncbi:DUF4870 domain-containing protein [Infirmifilum uzonense]|uniref:DUF4870 domain-containing protein n=1 Tax=Infirmifilum uzonense TaxID=1550241 RepID=UPI003C721DE7